METTNDMDKIIVRLVIIVSTIYMIVSFVLAWIGVDSYYYDTLFFPSLLNGILLTVLCHSQGKYHCVYMRGLCYGHIIIPSTIFLDYMLDLFEDAFTSLLVLSSMLFLSIISTLFLAIRHFRKVKKLKRQRNEIH